MRCQMKERPDMSLAGKTILITGAARRIGRHLALTVAAAGADLVLHHAHSPEEASQTAAEIERMGRKVWVLEADFAQPTEAEGLIERARALAPLYALVNNGAVFEPLSLAQTTLTDWQRTLNINLTAPFLLSRDFGAHLPPGETGRIVNILDWRALRPGGDHFPYTISKAALAAMTRSLAVALAPNITVNGLALGAILPPSTGGTGSGGDFITALLRQVPAGRWAELDEVGQALLFLLEGPDFITGEIIHLDGGRHLV
jgi:NAD(P)-dependent dehydrogenase (short-subunit alcohol dehydrogenase family)